MSLRFVIDGYNIIKHPLVAPEPKKTKDPCFFLIDLIRFNNLTGSPNNNVIIVFDGYPDRNRIISRPQGIQIIFSGKQSADDYIRAIVERAGGGKNTVVVSDDKQIQLSARFFRAQVLGVEEFIRHKERKIKKAASIGLKPEITYAQMHSINMELRKLWLGE